MAKSEEKQELPEGITDQMVADAKAKYGEKNVVIAELYNEDNEHLGTVLVRRPDRRIKGEFSKFVEKSPNRAEDILVTNCVLSHKEQVKASEEMFEAALDAVNQLIVQRKAVLKNC